MGDESPKSGADREELQNAEKTATTKGDTMTDRKKRRMRKKRFLPGLSDWIMLYRFVTMQDNPWMEEVPEGVAPISMNCKADDDMWEDIEDCNSDAWEDIDDAFLEHLVMGKAIAKHRQRNNSLKCSKCAAIATNPKWLRKHMRLCHVAYGEQDE